VNSYRSRFFGYFVLRYKFSREIISIFEKFLWIVALYRRVKTCCFIGVECYLLMAAERYLKPLLVCTFQGVTSPKMMFFIVTSLKNSNPTS